MFGVRALIEFTGVTGITPRSDQTQAGRLLEAGGLLVAELGPIPLIAWIAR